MIKKSKTRNFWNKVRSKYKLSFFNENTLEEVWTFRLSQLGAFLFFTGLVASICFATAFIIAGTPLKNLLPGYLKAETRLEMIGNALRLDSISQVLERNNLYYKNLEKILKGEVTTGNIDALSDSMKILPIDSLRGRSEATEAFIKEYENAEKYNLSAFSKNVASEGQTFYTPITGVIERGFNPAADNFGVKVLPATNSSISAVLDGTVIQTSFSINSGYAIVIQHTNNFISVYKNATSLLKHTGDKISGGEKIALINFDKNPKSESTVEFELWNKGQALNPTEYISF